MNLLVSRKRLLGNIGDFLWSYGGYLIVSALCDLCGVVLDKSNTRNFVSGCIESLYDTLKTNLSVDGVNYALSLNDDLISKFIEFYKGKEGTLIGSKFEIASPNLDLPFTFTKADQVPESSNTDYLGTDLCSFVINKDCNIAPSAYCLGTDSISSRSLFGSSQSLSMGDIISFKYLWRTWGSSNNHYILNMYRNGSYLCQAYQGYGNRLGQEYLGLYFLLKVDTSLIDKDTFKSFVGAAYPSTLGDVSTLEEYKVKYEKEPTEIVLDSSIVNIKTKWKKESTDIYISDGNVENLPDGVSIVYKKYLFKEGNECTDITGGWGKYYTDTHWYWNSANSKGGNVDNAIFLNMESGTSNGALCSLGTNEKIDFSNYSKIGIEYSAVVDDIVAAAYIVLRLQIRDNYSGSEIQPSVRNWLLKSTGNLEIFTEAEFNLGNINEMLYLVPILISERWHTGSAKIKKIWLE